MNEPSKYPDQSIYACRSEKASAPTEDRRIRSLSMASESIIPIDSRTSTLKYDQEPFDRYQSRVRELCKQLWPSTPPAESQTTGVTGGRAKSRILDAVKARTWRRLPIDNPEKQYNIERLDGGTYNRIIGISFEDDETNERKDVILRVPRQNMAEFSHIEREVAILQYASQKTAIPVADIVKFDATTNNPLGSGYVIQSRLVGSSLQVIWDTLTYRQRCNIATELAKVILSLQEVKHSFPGLVEASVGENGDQKLSVHPFDIVSPYDVDWRQKITKPDLDGEVDTSIDGPLQWFGTQFGRWLASELLSDPSGILFWDYQMRLVEVARRMDALGFLGDGQNCLCHFDLAARNILVHLLPDGSAKISGIVDWDSAAFVPYFVSCAPPSWLWTDHRQYDAVEGEGPSTIEQEGIKGAFEEAIGSDNTWLANQPGYRLARELFYFAQHGVPDGVASSRADKLFEDWSALYKTMMEFKEDDDENGESLHVSDETPEGKNA